ncbi:MAG: hypothetical protein ACK5P7_04085 [Bdellovibrio sp.]
MTKIKAKTSAKETKTTTTKTPTTKTTKTTKTMAARAATEKKGKGPKKVTLAARFANLKKTMKAQIAKIKLPAL